MNRSSEDNDCALLVSRSSAVVWHSEPILEQHFEISGVYLVADHRNGSQRWLGVNSTGDVLLLLGSWSCRTERIGNHTHKYLVRPWGALDHLVGSVASLEPARSYVRHGHRSHSVSHLKHVPSDVTALTVTLEANDERLYNFHTYEASMLGGMAHVQQAIDTGAKIAGYLERAQQHPLVKQHLDLTQETLWFLPYLAVCLHAQEGVQLMGRPAMPFPYSKQPRL